MLISCNGNVIMNEYEDFESSTWYSRDTIMFVMPPMDDSTMIVPTIQMRSTDDFRFQNLDLLFRIDDYADTVTIPLYDEDGRFLGKGLIHLESVLQLPAIMLAPSKNHKIKMSSLMKCDTLEGMSNLGVKVEIVKE